MTQPLQRRTALGLLAATAWNMAAAQAPAARGAAVRVGSKIDTEGRLLGHLIVLALEANGIPTENKTSLGNTQIMRGAITSGAIDLYPEYTGTGLLVLLQPTPAVVDSLGGRPAAVLGYVRAEFRRRFGLEWLAPLGFNNTYALLMRGQQAQELGIVSVSDLGGYLRQ